MQRFFAAKEEKSTNEYSRDDDVAQLLSEDDGESLSFSPTADDSRLLLQHQHAEDADTSDIDNQEGWPITQVPEDVATARPGDDSHNATSDAIGFSTVTSVSRAVTESTYPRFHQPIDYVALPMVDVNNTGLELNRRQRIELPHIPTEEEDAKAVKRFAMCLTIILVALLALYMICFILYLVSEYKESNSTTLPSSALKFVPITCGLFIGVGSKIAREAVVARKKRLMDDARCYAGLAIFFVLLACAGSAIVLALRVGVTSGSIDNYGIKTLFG
jgi:hypothetical protein